MADTEKVALAFNSGVTLSSDFLLDGDTDPDGDTLLLLLVEAITGGTVTLDARQIVFHPKLGFYGQA